MLPAKPPHGGNILEEAVLSQGIDHIVQLVLEPLILQVLLVIPPRCPELITPAKIAPQVADTRLFLNIGGKEHGSLVRSGFKKRVLFSAHGHPAVSAAWHGQQQRC